MVAIFLGACTPKATQETTDTTTTTKTKSSAAYETTVIKDGIASPKKEMSTSIGDTKVTVVYGSPSVKGRTVWGDLVPFDEVWRTGANEATTFETSTDLKIQGEELPAGKYGLFTIPTEKGDWTVIFNSTADQWGAYKYEESNDVLRVNTTTKALKDTAETMDFMMEGNNLVFQWENLTFSVEVSL